MAKLMAPNIRIDWYPEGHFVDVENPTIDELNSGYNLSCAVVTGFTLNFTDSETENTTTIFDDFQSETISTYAYEANLQFFLAERNASERDSDNVKAFKSAERLFSNRENVKGYLGKRYGHKGTADYELGQHYTLFEVQADLPKVVSEESAPILLDVNYVPQGFAYIHVPKSTYEWAGTPHASESIKYVDEVEVMRNEAFGAPTTTNSIEYDSDFDNSELNSFTITGENPPYVGYSGGMHVVTPGEYFGHAVTFDWGTGNIGRVRHQVQFRGPNSESIAAPQITADKRDYPNGGRIHAAYIVPEGTWEARVYEWFYVEGTFTAPTASSQISVGRFSAAITDSEQEALKQVETYFDGDRPDEYL